MDNMLGLRFDLDGVEEFQANLRRAVEATQDEHLVAATLDASEPTRRAASLNAPIGESGNLSRNMQKTVVNRDKHEVEVAVGPSRREWYGLHVEYERPFLRPAIDATRNAFFRRLAHNLGENIERAVR